MHSYPDGVCLLWRLTGDRGVDSDDLSLYGGTERIIAIVRVELLQKQQLSLINAGSHFIGYLVIHNCILSITCHMIANFIVNIVFCSNTGRNKL